MSVQPQEELVVSFDWISDVSQNFTDALVVLLNEVAIHERNMGFNEPITEKNGLSGFKDLLRGELEGGAEILAAWDQGQLVGTVTLVPSKLPARRHVVEVKRCVIARSHRGTFLRVGWAKVKALCEQRGWSNLVIDVRTDYVPTLKAWEALGFVEFGRLPKYAYMDGKFIDGIFMYYDLKAT